LHSASAAGRRDPDADPSRAEDLHELVDSLETESTAVGDGTSIAVDAAIRAALEELVDQVAVGCLQFDAVEAGASGELGCSSKLPQNLLNISG